MKFLIGHRILPNNLFVKVACNLILILTLAPLAASSSPLVKDSPKKGGIQINAAYGSISEAHLVPGAKCVIYMEDAHDSLEAQIHLAKLIRYFVQRRGIKKVIEEGYEGTVPTEKYFGDIPLKVRRKMGFYLLDHLRMGGAEFAHLLDPRSFHLMGADSFSVLDHHQELYRKEEADRPATKSSLRELENYFDQHLRSQRNKQLRDLILLRLKKNRGTIALPDYWSQLWRSHCQNSEHKCAERYPALSRLLIANQSIDYHLSSHSSCQEKVLQEMEHLERSALRDAVHRAQEEKLSRHLLFIEDLIQLNKLQIGPGQFKRLKDELGPMNTVKLISDLPGRDAKPWVFSKAWERGCDLALQYYSLTFDRDKVVRRYLHDWRDQEPSKEAILVYGGFHRSSMTEIFRELGLSYVVITPKITHASFKHQMRFQHLLSGAFYPIERQSGFARAARRAPSFYQMALKNPRAAHLILNSVQTEAYSTASKRSETRGTAGEDPGQVRPDDAEAGEIEALKMRIRELEKWAELGALFPGLAHDINNLIGIVMGGVSLLENDFEKTGFQSEWPPVIAHALQQILGMLRHGMSLSNSRKLDKAPFNVNDALRQTEEFSLYLVQKNKIKMVIKLLPEEIRINGHCGELANVLINLIKNSVEAIQARRKTLPLTVHNAEDETLDFIEVGVRMLDSSETLEIRVQDSGIGIRPEDRERIFQGGFTTKSNGHGIGMMNVFRTVKDYGGSLDLQSKPGEGTTFIIHLPVLAQSASAREPAATSLSHEMAEWNFSRVTILDDDATILGLWERVIHRLVPQAHVRTFQRYDPQIFEGSGAENSQPELMITDNLVTPSEVAAIRVKNPRVFIVISSAGEVRGERSLEGLADGDLSKPFSIDEIIAKLKLWVSQAAQRNRSELRETIKISSKRRLDGAALKLRAHPGAVRSMVWIRWSNLMALTPRQFKNDIEKMALRHPQLHFVIYGRDGSAVQKKLEKQVLRLKKELGYRRFHISKDSFESLAAHSQWQGKMIHVAKQLDVEAMRAIPSRSKKWIRVQYEGNEIGVVAMALLYAEGNMDASKRVLRLSALPSLFQEMARSYVNDLLIWRAA